ncbi:hypothetical protein [Streptomyces sp. NPDC058861]|uniref:hypothetical protein n=1 Tax=Streptomyces sp. NPDC058861 TaxID=3346653 RepID=UPI0036BAFF8D
MKKLIATALFTGAFAAGTAMTAPADLAGRTTTTMPSADTLYDLLDGDLVDETPPAPRE